MIETAGLKFSYSQKKEFELDVPFLNFREGEITSLIGPNGSGKTTLLKIITGIIERFEGTVRIKGKDIRGYGSKDRGRLIAYIPQAGADIFDFSVEEIVSMGRRPYMSFGAGAGKEGIKKINAALESFGLSDKKHRKMSELSGGERKAVYICRAIVQEAEILVMDEATAFLDIHHTADTLKSIKKLAKEGKTVITVSHDINLCSEISDEIVLMKNGKVKRTGKP
ncbi:MAG TPA: ABC transporter ATP-binding protein, partial [Firmicutes bacterium]|nr:ABC transporter ATP-binding protein [Bacillota bacterium]